MRCTRYHSLITITSNYCNLYLYLLYLFLEGSTLEFLRSVLLKWKGCELCFLHYHFLMIYSTRLMTYSGSNSDNTGFSRTERFKRTL